MLYLVVQSFLRGNEDMARPISIENAEHYNWGDNCDGWHLVQSEQLSVIQERVPSGACEMAHKHEFAEQFFFILSGQASLKVEAETHILNPQQGLHVPAGAVHQLCNYGQDDLVFIVTSTPPSHSDRVNQ
ncbi:MAG: mannose-6-phosphate isomerase-like protein (cupin superfamily) [Pseudoalteromonas rhizosphaerae]|jgi:mannose-6-phosphate isomerase-like protein (cupin superfamily)